MQKTLSRLWRNLTEGARSTKFFNYSFLMNEGIWIHMIGGGILARIFHIFFSAEVSVLLVLAIAVLWEFIEYCLETPNKVAMLEIYESVEHYRYDTFGDIFGAVIIALLVVV